MENQDIDKDVDRHFSFTICEYQSRKPKHRIKIFGKEFT